MRPSIVTIPLPRGTESAPSDDNFAPNVLIPRYCAKQRFRSHHMGCAGVKVGKKVEGESRLSSLFAHFRRSWFQLSSHLFHLQCEIHFNTSLPPTATPSKLYHAPKGLFQNFVCNVYPMRATYPARVTFPIYIWRRKKANSILL